MGKNTRIVIMRRTLKTIFIFLAYVTFFSGVFFYWFISNPERIFTLQGLVALFSLFVSYAGVYRLWREMIKLTVNSTEHSHDSENS